jgi:hypothetical protein
MLTCVDHQRKHSRLSLRGRNHGHAVVPEAGGSGLLPWYALLDGRRHVLEARLTVIRDLVCYAQLRQRDRRRDQLLDELRQSVGWRDCMVNILDLRWMRYVDTST